MKKKTILDFRRMAAEGEKIVYLTGYDYLTAKYEERAGIDMILVGDSLGNVILGYDSTYPVTMEDMLIHCKAVRRGAPNTFIVGDMAARTPRRWPWRRPSMPICARSTPMWTADTPPTPAL